MEYVPSPEEAVILTSTNLTVDVFGSLMWACQDIAWMANVSPWSAMKSYDVVTKIVEFINGPDIANKSAAAPELAAYLGAGEDRVQLLYDSMYDWYGWTFPDMVETIADTMPLAGHPAHNSGMFIGILTLFTILAVIFIALRLYSRFIINGFLRGHDYILLVGAIFTFALSLMNAILLSGPTHYKGLWDRSWNNMRSDSISSIATSVLYPVGIFLIKTSLLLFYWNLSPWSPLRVASAVTGFIVFANCMTMIFTSVFRCKYPIGGGGFEEYLNNVCDDNLFVKSMDATGALNIITDVAIWVIPLPMVWRISQTLRERILASLTFGVGALACIACGFRFYSIRKVLEVTLLPNDQSAYLLWTMAEMYLAVICSCVPAIRALIIKKAPTLIGTNGVPYTEDGKSDEKTMDKNKADINIDDLSSNHGSAH